MKLGRILPSRGLSETTGLLSRESRPTSFRNACSSLPQNCGAAPPESLQDQSSRSNKILSSLNCVIAGFVKSDLFLFLAFAFLLVDLLK